MLQYILWNTDPDLITIFDRAVRWYGLLFASGFFLGMQIMSRIFKIENKNLKTLDNLLIYMLIGTVLGARLGHCLFYEADYYLSNPLEILYIWKGGLASHGAAIGILIAAWLYARKTQGQTFLWVMDRVVIVVALAGALIRMGNLMNSEIIGKPTTANHAFLFVNSLNRYLTDEHDKYIENVRFEKMGQDTAIEGTPLTRLKASLVFTPTASGVGIDQLTNYTKSTIPGFLLNYPSVDENFYLPNNQVSNVNVVKKGAETQAEFYIWAVPRHPAQLYEAFTTFLLFVVLMLVWLRYQHTTPQGILLGVFLVYIFGLRFLHEMLKENQVAFEAQMSYNMGQLLSIPLITIGLILIIYSLGNTQKNKTETISEEQ